MADFFSSFIFILPGIMAYFWLQVFGLTPAVKHNATEISGIAALLWLPVSFVTLLFLNICSFINFPIMTVWTIADFSLATSDIRYLLVFLLVSIVVSFIICLVWSLWGSKFLNSIINFVRKKRKIASLSPNTTVWAEFFIKFSDEEDEDKEAVYIIHKFDNPDNFIIGSMVNVSRPLENDKVIVLAETSKWEAAYKEHFDYEVKRIYIDTITGMVIKELDYKDYKTKRKTIPVE